MKEVPVQIPPSVRDNVENLDGRMQSYTKLMHNIHMEQILLLTSSDVNRHYRFSIQLLHIAVCIRDRISPHKSFYNNHNVNAPFVKNIFVGYDI